MECCSVTALQHRMGWYDDSEPWIHVARRRQIWHILGWYPTTCVETHGKPQKS